MDNANAVTTTGGQNSVAPFSFDFGSEFIKENLPAEKRTELAVVAQNVKLDLAQDVAARTIRLQASSMDMALRMAGIRYSLNFLFNRTLFLFNVIPHRLLRQRK